MSIFPTQEELLEGFKSQNKFLEQQISSLVNERDAAIHNYEALNKIHEIYRKRVEELEKENEELKNNTQEKIIEYIQEAKKKLGW